MPVRAVAVTGAAGPVGQRLVPQLAGGRVVAIDTRTAPGVETVVADLATADLDPVLDGVDTVVHLAWSPPVARGGAQTAKGNVDATRRLLVAADRAGVRSLVHVSSASVYGAWPDNPVPLTEEAALRPNPGVPDAIGRGEAERLVADWAQAHPGATVAVLRPAVVLGPGLDSWLARVLAGPTGGRPGATDPPRQFVHADDLASAVALAVHGRLDGVYNVAPDGSMAGDVVRGLTAGRPRLPVPGKAAAALAGWAWSLHLSDVPPALLPLLEHPWVVANDRLRAAGWQPRHTNEEAVVAGRRGSRWREMGPGRRQQVALIGAGAGITGAGALVALIIARSRRQRRS